jgi:hypothetical protein
VNGLNLQYGTVTESEIFQPVFYNVSYFTKFNLDRLCGLVVKVPDYRFRGLGLIPGATRIFLRSSGSGTGSTQPRDDN